MTPEDIQIIKELLATAIAPIIVRLDLIDERVNNIDDNVHQLVTSVSILNVKSQNSQCGRDDELQVVPLPGGNRPTVAYPKSIANLIVSGNERLPNGTVNNWNSLKSAALIKQYEPDYATDEETQEDTARSRNRRLKLAKLLGVTSAQLNFAQLTL